MDNRSLVRISLGCSVAGILLIYGLSLMIEPKGISINILDRYQGRIVRVTGTVVDLRRHDAGHIFVKLKDESGICEVPIFKDLASKVPRVSLGDRLQVVGIAEEYRDAQQVVPRTERDLGILPLPPVSIQSAKGRIGDVIRLTGIAYKVRDLGQGQEFHLTDGDSSILVSSYGSGVIKSGFNVTISGTVKSGDDGSYLAAREICDLSPEGAKEARISDLDGRAGIFLVRGSLLLDDSGALLDDGSGTVNIPGDALESGVVDGDLIEAVVQIDGDGMNVLEVQLDKANILPLERLSGEMVGKTVRIKGTVISKFVSGENTFLTVHNGTDVEVPLFGTGEDFNVQLGDVLTISGRVGIYRDKLQVVPRDLSETKVDPGRIVERELDEISLNDLYQLVRTRGRISSIRRYAKSCSLWIKGESEKVRVYLTFQPQGNISVGTEMEVIGLVKSYREELELVPRGQEDLG